MQNRPEVRRCRATSVTTAAATASDRATVGSLGRLHPSTAPHAIATAAAHAIGSDRGKAALTS